MTRVAIVEDNQRMRECLAAYVRTDPGFECVGSCATAEQALDLLPRQLPEIVLMDIQLPSLSGIACAERLKQLLPEVKIIMVTVFGDPDTIFKALRAGACGYLLKRCTPEQLIAALREVRLGGAPMSREIARKLIDYFQQSAGPTPADGAIENLSPREREVLEWVARGLTDKEIADRLGLRHGTVRWHLQRVYDKLHVRTRTEAALRLRSREN